MIDVDGSVYTYEGRYNHSTEKPYVEIFKDGEHYAYMPWSLLPEHIRNNWRY